MTGVVLDLFRGAGGWAVAADQLGIPSEGVEKNPLANATATAAGHRTAWLDVWDPPHLRSYRGNTGSPPCTTFSKAGKGTGAKHLNQVVDLVERGVYRSLRRLHDAAEEVGDERTALVLTPLHYVGRTRPEWVAWEQVPAVLPVWEVCATVLRRWGYNVWTGLVHAEQYGVPQARTRAVLIASATRDVGRPTPTHSRYYPQAPARLDPGVAPWVSMAQALGWAEYAPGTTLATPLHTRAYDASRPRTPDQPAPTLTFGHAAAEWCWKRPATTIVGTFHPEIVAAPGYRTTVSRQDAPDSVTVTLAEAGVLQSFPADYPWRGGPRGGQGPAFLQVGNAIPPLMARAILQEATGIG